MVVTLFVDSSSEQTRDILLVTKFCRFPQGNYLKVNEDEKAVEEAKLNSTGQLPILQAEKSTITSGFDNVLQHLAQNFAPELLENHENQVQWLKYRQHELSKPNVVLEDLSSLDEHLLPRVFIASNQLSLSDLVLFSALHPVMKGFNEKQKIGVANVFRWFDHIQHQTLLKHSTLPVITLKGIVPNPLVSNTEKHVSEQPVNQEEQSTPAKETLKNSNDQQQQQQQQPTPQKEQKQQKQQQEKKAPQKQQPKATAAKEEQPDLTRLNIVIGRILEVSKHPDANNLYIEKIDVGEAEPRTIVSGLVQFVTEEELKGRNVVVLLNLKPKKARGVDSNGMVLCASDATKTKVEPLDPPPGVVPGERISFEGFEGPPEPVLNPKKKYFEKVQPDWSTTTERVAVYKNIPFLTSKGAVTVKSIVNGTIS